MIKKVWLKAALVALMSVISAAAFALDQVSLGRALYPNNDEDTAFVAKFFELVEAHKTKDPLLEGRGPSIKEYSLDKIKFAFMINETSDTIDLAFFNWSLSMIPGFKIQEDLSKMYGSPVYILRGVPKKLVASQGDNRDQLTNFSYIFGARYMEMQIKRGNPEMKIPQQLLDWKPHPDYMDRSHPLRKTLDTQALVLLSPSKEMFFKQSGMDEKTRPYFEAMMNAIGGFQNAVMGMMVHEMFHVKEGEDQVNGLAAKRPVHEDRKALVEQLKADAYLKTLMGTYVKIVFSLGDQMKAASVSPEEKAMLADLKTVIAELKTKYENGWKFIWNYEYTEGFAEYVSAYSMVQVGVTSFAQKIDLEKGDHGNNFAYRTGALGGLYLSSRLGRMPFSNNEDHRESVWEIVLKVSKVQNKSTPVQEVIAKYNGVAIDADDEVKKVIDYLISTVMDVN